MGRVLDELVTQLTLEKIEENLFRGQSQDLGWGTVYGGQVLGQALSAAAQTVPDDRFVHSLHSYFLRPGDVDRPIVYDVDRIRDGGSFTTRRVVAIQNGRAIFNMSASFQIEESGFAHQNPMPTVPQPADLGTDRERMAKYADKLPALLKKRARAERPFEMRPVDPVDDPFQPDESPPNARHWMKATGTLDDDASLHRFLLAYVSDFNFLTTSLRPHGVTWLSPGMQVASVDHAMWFHRPIRVDDWLLHCIQSPSASGARGFVYGHIYNTDGDLVASTAQEGLLRQHPPKDSESS